MAKLGRVLPLLLALVATGTLPTLAAPERVCSEGIGTGDASPCRDCSPTCALCLCCPLRAAPTEGHAMPSGGTAVVERLKPSADHPALRSGGASIFHPPRA